MSEFAKKSKLSFKSMLKLSLGRERIANRIITIILSAFAFMLFAFASMGVTYNEINQSSRTYFNYSKNNHYIIFTAKGDKGTDDFTQKLSVSEIERYEEEAGLKLVYLYQSVDWAYYVGTVPSRYNKEGYATEGDLYDEWTYDRYFAGRAALAGSEQDYNSLGFTLLAGRYPTAKNEIAISEAHYEAFKNRGYYDATKNAILETKTLWDTETESYYEINSYTYDYSASQYEGVTEINDYSDLIGKTLGSWVEQRKEDAEFGYTIVGVVDTGYHPDFENRTEQGKEYLCDPAGHIMFSEYYKKNTEKITYCFCAAITDYKIMKKCMTIVYDFFEAQGKDGNFPAMEYCGYLLPQSTVTISLGDFIVTDQLTAKDIIGIVAFGAGIFFGIFAVILNGHLISRSMEDKQKKIGILRAMGADDQTAAKIFLTEILLTATAIFLLALVASLIVFYGWLNPWMSWEVFETGILVYNGWTVLILAAVSYLVPLVSAFVPLRKFFKKPIIDNITGNTQRKGTRSKRR